MPEHSLVNLLTLWTPLSLPSKKLLNRRENIRLAADISNIQCFIINKPILQCSRIIIV